MMHQKIIFTLAATVHVHTLTSFSELYRLNFRLISRLCQPFSTQVSDAAPGSSLCYLQSCGLLDTFNMLCCTKLLLLLQNLWMSVYVFSWFCSTAEHQQILSALPYPYSRLQPSRICPTNVKPRFLVMNISSVLNNSCCVSICTHSRKRRAAESKKHACDTVRDLQTC